MKIKQKDLFEIEEDEDRVVIQIYEPCTIMFTKEGEKKNGKIKYF